MLQARPYIMTDTTISAAGRERSYYPLRLRDVLAVMLFWGFLALVSAATRQLDPRIPDVGPRVLNAVLRATYIEYSLWAAVTVPILWLTSRYSIEGGRRIERVLFFVALGFVIAIAMDSFLFQMREQFLEALRTRTDGFRGRDFALQTRRRPPPPLIGFGILDDLMVYFAVLGAGVARDYFLRYNAGVKKTAELQAQLAQARLDVLRTQLNPHFLFNTLNAVSALVERDARGARKMIARLSDLLRYTLEEGTDQEVPLHRELDLLGEYVELMQIRFQGKLTVSMDIADDVHNALVPNLILQPIVENALKHGVGQVTSAGVVTIAARRAGDRLVLSVTDNGRGPGAGAEGVGLANTNARLHQMYGDEFRVTLRAASPRGTIAELTLPYHTTAIAPVVAGRSA